MFDTVALLMIGFAPWLKTPRGDVHPVTFNGVSLAARRTLLARSNLTR
jgi:hypothetical protein